LPQAIFHEVKNGEVAGRYRLPQAIFHEVKNGEVAEKYRLPKAIFHKSNVSQKLANI